MAKSGDEVIQKPLDGHERWTDTWIEMSGGKWQCVASTNPRSKCRKHKKSWFTSDHRWQDNAARFLLGGFSFASRHCSMTCRVILWRRSGLCQYAHRSRIRTLPVPSVAKGPGGMIHSPCIVTGGLS